MMMMMMMMMTMMMMIDIRIHGKPGYTRYFRTF